ncbi:MAG: PAS domain-containing protein [Phenylobacterium sp.]|uniref:PAS domain-containing protein n=1 Tax=Phenylobacterium sp. TaxID=1871053 RepID=UPI00391CDBAB
MTRFHSNTQRLIDYWRELGADSRPPRREAVDPSHFARLAPQVFMLGRIAPGLYPVRLAGGLVTELHADPLRGRNLLSLFRERDRFLLQTALETARRRPEPVVATVQAVTEDGAALPLELLFAPLAGEPERFFGLYQPLAMVSRLDERPIREFALGALQGVGPANEETPRLRLATLGGRRVA